MPLWLVALGFIALLIAVGVWLDRRWGSPAIGSADNLPGGKGRRMPMPGAHDTGGGGGGAL